MFTKICSKRWKFENNICKSWSFLWRGGLEHGERAREGLGEAYFESTSYNSDCNLTVDVIIYEGLEGAKSFQIHILSPMQQETTAKTVSKCLTQQITKCTAPFIQSNL